METQTRPRSQPDLPPVYVDRHEHQAYHGGPAYAARTSPLFSASVLRPDPLPSAMLPATGNDMAMRLHERAMVDSLDQRGRRLEPQYSPGTARSLSPIAEQGLSSRRASMASLPLLRAPAPSPHSPSFLQYPRRPTLASETRSILLLGLNDEGSGAVPDGLPRITSSSFDERRQSLPSSFVTPAPRRNSHQLRQELHAWGHVFLGNGSEAQCFVSAVSLRRSSGNSSPYDEDTTMKDGSPETPEPSSQLTVRVRVRPCALDRKPFLLTRTFDMDMLRATVPEPSPVMAGPRRISADARGRNPSPTSFLVSTGEASAGLDSILQIRGGNTVPIHRPYACAFFPVLAALLYSKHIQPRDIIDLPLPHPEVWGQTVAHVYTGQGELTEAIKQNILYLGGKV
ncbi:hypothetical protein QBC40DRAFT_8512 [Triangularia verruculosa]|uniref:Uncharacterized protein n=1 Tax=Triangularia verruculosa TaxID=2587418 RepID=A0AAN6XNM1_9PEZI|nr:hypothetical protein QBC40DRAFT_8512 [Triangularia verruculosa]